MAQNTSSAQQRILLLVLVLAFTVGLFFLGKNNPTALVGDDKDGAGVSASAGRRAGASLASRGNLEVIRQQALNQLDNPARDSLQQLREAGDLARLAAFWERREIYPLAGAYYLQQAEQDSTLGHWRKAAETLFRAEKTIQDSATFHYFLHQSQRALENVLAMDPDDVDAKADLAVAYVDQNQVMRGVGLLKEVLAVDPNNEKALFYLGALSLQSNQLDKALERFQKLVDLQPQNPFHYYYLGQVLLRQNERDRALAAFEQYRNRLSDPKLKRQAQQMIEQLKNS